MAEVMATAGTDSPPLAASLTSCGTYRAGVLYSITASAHILFTQLAIAPSALLAYGYFTVTLLKRINIHSTAAQLLSVILVRVY